MKIAHCNLNDDASARPIIWLLWFKDIMSIWNYPLDRAAAMLTIYIAILKFSRLNQHSFHLALVHNFCIHLGVTYHGFIQQWFHSLDYFKPLLHTYQTFMNERVIIQVGAVPQDQLPWLVPSHMIPQDTYFYCDFEMDVSSLVLVWRLVFIHQHQGCYKFSRHYVYTWQGYRQFIWRLVDYSFTPDAISKTKGLTPIFFLFHAVDFTLQMICLGGLPCSLLTDYGRIGVFWHTILFPLIQCWFKRRKLFIDRAPTSRFYEV